MAEAEDKLQVLEERLERAERVIHELSELVLNGAISTVSAPFRVVDPEGKKIFEVSVTEKGFDRRVQVFDKNEKAHAALGSDVSGGNLVIRNNAGAMISYLSVGPDGARFELNTSSGHGGIGFYTDGDGGGVVVSDIKGQVTAELYATAEGGVLVLRDENDVPLVIFPAEAKREEE